MPPPSKSGAPERRSGPLLAVGPGAGLSDHACWGYCSDAERADVASAWLTEGLALGQRALYVGDGSLEQLVAELATVPDRDAALASGSVVVAPADAMYDLGAPIDPAAQLDAYDDMVRQALADGFTGVCVAADITPLVRDAARRRAHVHWEQFADRYMTEHPLAPVCLYDVRQVGELEAIVCAHPLQGPGLAPFSIHAMSATVVAVTGELDSFAADVLDTVLATSPATDDVLDLAAVGFVDARSAWVLQNHLGRRRAVGRPVAVRGATDRLWRVWDVCGFDPTLLSA